MMANEHATGNHFTSELLASAEAAVACAGCYQDFVNESEAIVGRFCNALQRLKHQRLEHEREILESIEEKDVLVHFLFDCVRNRFLYRDRVGKAKEQLTEASSVWDKAFKNHLARCETCRTVELRKRDAASASRPQSFPHSKFPIPHCLEVLALGALILPLFVWLKGEDCHTHWLWMLVAVLLMLPLCAFMFALRIRPGRGKILSCFIAGRYSGSEYYRKLGIFWAPSHSQLLEPPTSQEILIAKKLVCFSFGWWSRQTKLVDNTQISVNAAVPTTDQDIVFPITVSSDTCRWRSAAGQLQADGSLTGLSLEASFDGSSVELSGRGEDKLLWTKIGFWRLDIMFKLLTMLAVIGLCALIAMVFYPPGVDFKCFSQGISRLPLRAVFLLDGSASINPAGWDGERNATESIIKAFQAVYGGKDSGLLYLGLAQFTNQARIVVNVTSDIASLLTTLHSMKQDRLGTAFLPALQLCLAQLAAYKGAGPQTFDVCVLITDGESDEAAQSLKVPVDTALFGIYVGKIQSSEDKLRNISTCGKANHSSSCHYFARASNFTELNEIAHTVAENIVKGADAASGYEKPKKQPGYLPFLFLLLLPFLTWWAYLLWERRPAQQGSDNSLVTPLRDPQRMRTVGLNEARTTVPMPSQR